MSPSGSALSRPGAICRNGQGVYCRTFGPRYIPTLVQGVAVNLSGKHVVITGASSGIGEALAKEFGRAGARLTLVARRRELLDRLSGEIGGGCIGIAHDLSDPSKALDWIPAAEAAHGPIDVLVNTAGVAPTGRSEAIGADELESLLNLNFVVPIRITHHLLPGMIARKSAAIVNVGSVAGLVPVPWQTCYSATKAGLGGFSEALRGELLGTGVVVLSVYPGPVTTELGEKGYAALGGRTGINRLVPEGTPDVLAVKIRSHLENERARLVYPGMLVTSRWFPNWTRWMLDKVAPRVFDKMSKPT